MRKTVCALAVVCFWMGSNSRALAEPSKTPAPQRQAGAAQLENDGAAALSASQALLQAADRDGDGTLSFSEFSAAVQKSINRRVAERFQQLDRNRDGLCARSEVNKMSAARFARFDRNRDGFFSATELRQAIMSQLAARLGQVYARLDRDNDGRFSLAELTPSRSKPATKTAKAGRSDVAKVGFTSSN